VVAAGDKTCESRDSNLHPTHPAAKGVFGLQAY
jgi:hypothetical protein